MAFTTAIVGLGIGGGALLSNQMSKQQKLPTPTPLPQPPSIEDAADKANKISAARKASATDTVFTNPIGIGGQADVAKKVLLGT